MEKSEPCSTPRSERSSREYILLQSGLQSGMQSGNGSDRLRNDFVLAMTGYHPDVELLAHVGVTLDPIFGRPDCDPEPTRRMWLESTWLAC